jgi:hypothetical protein
MSEDHVFIDSLGNRMTGRETLLAGWRAYFQLFSDYWIEVDGMFVNGGAAMLHGCADGTLHRGGKNGTAADGIFPLVAGRGGERWDRALAGLRG